VSAEGGVFVLDSFAVLAYLGGETGQERVKQVLADAQQGSCRAVLTLINLGEVAYIIERQRGLAQAQEALGLIDQLPIEILPADKELVLGAAHIKANYPLAYADAFSAAAGLLLDGVVLTGDPEFARLGELVQVEMIKPG
jgi:predicted nucleic acid-binding protein